jgi:hypothetical protein
MAGRNAWVTRKVPVRLDARTSFQVSSGHGQRRLSRHDAGVVHQNIGRSKRGLHIVAKARHVSPGDRTSQARACTGSVRRAKDRRGNCLRACLGRSQPPTPLPGEEPGNGSADATRGTGHDRQASLELAHASPRSAFPRWAAASRRAFRSGRSRMSPTNALVSDAGLVVALARQGQAQLLGLHHAAGAARAKACHKPRRFGGWRVLAGSGAW